MQGARGRWKATSQLFPGGVKKFTRKTITNAQLLTLFSVGLLGLVPDPGAGYIAIVDALTFELIYGTTPFTGGGAVTLQYHGTTANVLSSTITQANMQGSAAFVSHYTAAQTAGGIVVPTTHAGLDLVAAGADFAAGDSTARAYISSRIIKL